jgi:hypothetical protein
MSKTVSLPRHRDPHGFTAVLFQLPLDDCIIGRQIINYIRTCAVEYARWRRLKTVDCLALYVRIGTIRLLLVY